jgi:hypothetical protein
MISAFMLNNSFRVAIRSQEANLGQNSGLFLACCLLTVGSMSAIIVWVWQSSNRCRLGYGPK